MYLIEVKTDEKRAEHRFYKALQDNIDRLQLDKVIKEGRAATALLREIGEPLPPPVKVKTGWFSADYYGFEDMLTRWDNDQSSLSIYHREIKEEQQEQQRKQQQIERETKQKQEDDKKRRQDYERYLSKYGYVKDAEYDHISDHVASDISMFTRLQAQAWASNDMQEYIRCSKQKYEQISDRIAYERDLKKIGQLSRILDKDRQALADILPQLMPYYEQMQQAVNKRKILLENERQPSFKPRYDQEQPKPKKRQ